MKAVITGETDERVGVNLLDNNEVEHGIEMEFDGEIKYHEQDGYPDDPKRREPEESEHVHQTREFARYYVYAERGYDTLSPEINPDRLEGVRHVIESLSTEACMDLFGDLYQQMQSHHSDADRLLEIPAAAKSPELVLYRKDVYLGVDPTETALADQAQSVADTYGLDLSEPPVHDQSIAELHSSERATWEAFGDELGELFSATDTDASDGMYIDAVSDLYMAYPDERGREHITDANQPFEREPDARFELGPIDPRSPEDFQEYLAFNLKCQIRDCFVRMGVQPPEEFRVLGYGRYEAAERYNKVEFYPKFHDPENETLLQ